MLETDLPNLKFTYQAQIRRKEELEREVDRIMVDQDSVECKLLGLQAIKEVKSDSTKKSYIPRPSDDKKSENEDVAKGHRRNSSKSKK